MRPRLKRAVLLVLLACDCEPMPEEAMISAVGLSVRPSEPTDGDIAEAVRDCEAEGYITGATDDFTREKTWTLTLKGTHKARQLR